MDIEEIAETVERTLKGEGGDMRQAGFGVTALADLGEVYLRAPDGNVFKMVLEPVSADDAEGWGIEFDG